MVSFVGLALLMLFYPHPVGIACLLVSALLMAIGSESAQAWEWRKWEREQARKDREWEQEHQQWKREHQVLEREYQVLEREYQVLEREYQAWERSQQEPPVRMLISPLGVARRWVPVPLDTPERHPD
jgi:hypothetical protein